MKALIICNRSLSFVIIIVIFFSCSQASNQAQVQMQRTGSIEGQVVDSKSGRPLPGVQIFLEVSRRGAVSGIDGHDVFNLRASINITDDLAILGRVGNLTDELYAERATYNRFRGDEFAPAAPRTFNISLRFGL